MDTLRRYVTVKAIGIFLALVVVGWFAGQLIESLHLDACHGIRWGVVAVTAIWAVAPVVAAIYWAVNFRRWPRFVTIPIAVAIAAPFVVLVILWGTANGFVAQCFGELTPLN